MMGLKSFALVLWLSHCLSIAFAVSRDFSGNGYLKYDILGNNDNKPINSDVDELSLTFRTLQPTGLLFHSQNSGGDQGDYITLEVIGGRLRYSVRLGGYKDKDTSKEVFLGKDLSNGKPHTVKVTHNKLTTTVVLDPGSSLEETREIKTSYKKLDVDVAIFVGGSSSFVNLQGVKSNEPFQGCLTDVEFKPENQKIIKFLVKGVADAVKVDMDKECSTEISFEPYTFSARDSSFTFTIKKQAAMTGSFKFRTYEKFGTLLKQDNGNNKFMISYKDRFLGLKVTIGGTDTDVSITYSVNEPKVNSGNWHTVEYGISASFISLTVGTKPQTSKPPGVSFPNNFFGDKVTAGGFTGCMRDLKINGQLKKPVKGVDTIKNVETDSCNITDMCIFSPCLNKGSCSQTGKTFTCDCSASGHKPPMCQFPDSSSNCAELKKRKPDATSKNWTLDLDGPGPLKASSGIYCNMTADPPITVVYSEDQGVKVVTDNNAGTPNQPYVADIRYYPSFDYAKALAMNSENCKQFIEFGCKKAKLLDAGGSERLGIWVSADGVYQDYWGGAPPNSESCACGVNNTCQPDKSKKCNCDARADIWTKDEGWLTATADLPVSQVVFKDVNPLQSSVANFTVGNLYCSGDISNTATFVNEDGMIKLDKWTPPSHGVISLFFRTPYPKGTILYNGIIRKEYFWLYIINETTITLKYDIGNGPQRVELTLKDNKKINDRQWHEVVIYRNLKQFGLKLDTEEGVNENPLFLKKDLDLEDNLYVGGYPYDVSEGFVGCIRGLTINGEVINLNKKASSADYMEGGCGAACKNHQCKLGGKCLDNYNVYECDCSLTPFNGYFCQKDYGASFEEKDSQLTYTFPDPVSVPGVDIVFGFKVDSKDNCGGDIVEITSQTTDENFLLRLDPATKKLKFSFKSFGGDGSFLIDPPGGDFCDENRHTFALSRRNEKVNYTVDGVRKPVKNEDRLKNPFPTMEKIIVGRKGDAGFKGCITGVKVKRFEFGKTYSTAQPIKEFVYDGDTKGLEASGITGDSDTKCGTEPDTPEIPTPRSVGAPDGSDKTDPPADPTAGKRAQDDTNTAIIVVVVLILVLLLVVLLIVIYWYWARHKGEYHTHEDDDALESTDPYIDMTAPRKPLAEEESEKKKEWYI